MRVYHGSYIEVREPLVHVGRKSLDFGQGFYVTNIKEQAKKWAKRVCIIRNRDTPIINVYDLDINSILSNDYKILRILAYNKEWLDFIVACRRGDELWKDYDIIEGGVANDQVIDTVEDYYAGRITVEQALGQLRFAKPTHQMCIHKQEILDKYLKYIESIKI